MTNSSEEQLITLQEATRLFGSHRPHVSTIFRWARHGVRGVRLPYIRAGRRMLVKPSDVHEFCRRLAEADTDRDVLADDVAHRISGSNTTRQRSPKQAAADRRRADRNLDRAGI